MSALCSLYRVVSEYFNNYNLTKVSGLQGKLIIFLSDNDWTVFASRLQENTINEIINVIRCSSTCAFWVSNG